ncbi:unnamed protein product [Caenorhabditis sp. 36 PRJEB53466]|nr:unnamed protein product [Caenorhabditis sp. 36 PRJEB53466]
MQTDQAGIKPQSDAAMRFHARTAMLFVELLRTTGISRNMVNMNSVTALCRHLNPLVELPSLGDLETHLGNLKGYNPLISSNQPSCIMCGVEVPRHKSHQVTPDNAAHYLTASVLNSLKTISQAKKDILNTELTVCQTHDQSTFKNMCTTLGIEGVPVERVLRPVFSVGFETFNRIRGMRFTFEDVPVIPMEKEEYEKSCKKWMITIKSRAAKKRIEYGAVPIPPKVAKHPKYCNSMANFDRVFRRDDQEEPVFNFHSREDEKNDPFGEGTSDDVFMDVKQEEPDTYLPPARPVTFGNVPLTRPPTTIYTLHNGKTVVKAPVAAAILAERTSGKLVTYRLAKRMTEDSTGTSSSEAHPPTATALIRRVEYNPIPKTEPTTERKPEFIEFGSQPAIHSGFDQ